MRSRCTRCEQKASLTCSDCQDRLCLLCWGVTKSERCGRCEAGETNMVLKPWRLRAACQDEDTSLFYPEHGGTAGPARKICARCEVRTECLDYAIRAGEAFGVWGGMTERERRSYRLRLVRQAS